MQVYVTLGSRLFNSEWFARLMSLYATITLRLNEAGFALISEIAGDDADNCKVVLLLDELE
jgi:hypothetical protein